jgi:hypothetical protein
MTELVDVQASDRAKAYVRRKPRPPIRYPRKGKNDKGENIIVWVTIPRRRRRGVGRFLEYR